MPSAVSGIEEEIRFTNICPKTAYTHFYITSLFLTEGLTWDFPNHLDKQSTNEGIIHFPPKLANKSQPKESSCF